MLRIETNRMRLSFVCVYVRVCLSFSACIENFLSILTSFARVHEQSSHTTSKLMCSTPCDLFLVCDYAGDLLESITTRYCG